MHREDEPEVGQQELIEDQSWCHEDLQIPKRTPPEVRPPTPHDEPHPFLTQSSRQCRPAHVVPYPLWPANV